MPVRKSAYRQLKAIDWVLHDVLGTGLSNFLPPEADVSPSPVWDLPTLVLHMDEGSIGYCSPWYLQYRLDMRVLFVRDVFHREWNDIKGALVASNL
eukprot:7969435-Heterocapsa_arctica.AAC.1